MSLRGFSVDSTAHTSHTVAGRDYDSVSGVVCIVDHVLTPLLNWPARNTVRVLTNLTMAAMDIR